MRKTRYIIILTVLFFVYPIIGFAQANKLVRQGLRSDDLDERIALLSKAIEEDPKHLNAYFHRGLSKAEMEDYVGAVLDFTSVIFIKPDADSFYNRGNAKFSLGDFDGAYKDYLEAVNIDACFFDAHYNLGITQLNLKKYKEALTTFSFITKYNPEHVMAFTQIAHALLKLGYHKYAFMFYDKSIKLQKHSHTYYNRGLAYLEVHSFKKAKRDFKRAVELDPKNASAHYYIGIANLFSQNYDTAILSFNQALSFDSLDYESLFGLAIAYYHNNNIDEAKLCFDKAKSILNPWGKRTNNVALFKSTSWYEDERNVLELYFEKFNTL